MWRLENITGPAVLQAATLGQMTVEEQLITDQRWKANSFQCPQPSAHVKVGRWIYIYIYIYIHFFGCVPQNFYRKHIERSFIESTKIM